ncbi:MAG: hypothetical protein LBD94_01330 [Rickettsiales bacterium]|jgi:hypothetical protein|nr:hypothetical protein [Rickettsiales bacterium]
MKRLFRFFSIIMLMTSTSAHALKLCQLEWLDAWKNASGTLQNYRYSYSRSNYDYNGTNNNAGGLGTWAVTSDEGSTGVYHTVSGTSFCGSTSSGTYTNGTPSYSTTGTNNTNCWCRMTSPNLGGSWVFLFDNGSASNCAYYCARNCAYCVRNGTNNSCSRAAVLSLP